MVKFKYCDLIIYPEELINYSTFEMNKIEAIFNHGYQYTIEALKENPSLFS
ncbi:hypothetical protein [Olleya sp. ITB9]|uniref:hypothetical protein n=1 Tax=Olleya sp. ITB9 TaxID=1715648 RepID=UPI000B183667|nr:hypothetical protein [Olleya sp. ITB9]